MSVGSPGRKWNVVKLRPDGSFATRYDGTEVAAQDGWIAVEARWVHGRIDIGCFVFEPDDVLLEYFSLEQHYNAFASFRADGRFVAWYCNVTYPSKVTDTEIFWHDLYVDVVVLADGTVLVLDEDELEESALAESDSALHATILTARDELLALVARGDYPFSEVRETAKGGTDERVLSEGA